MVLAAAATDTATPPLSGQVSWVSSPLAPGCWKAFGGGAVFDLEQWGDASTPILRATQQAVWSYVGVPGSRSPKAEKWILVPAGNRAVADLKGPPRV